MATLEETVWIYIYDNDTNKYLRSETHTLTEEISGSSIVPAETLAYKMGQRMRCEIAEQQYPAFRGLTLAQIHSLSLTMGKLHCIL